jgi:hypothetical protein
LPKRLILEKNNHFLSDVKATRSWKTVLLINKKWIILNIQVYNMRM